MFKTLAEEYEEYKQKVTLLDLFIPTNAKLHLYVWEDVLCDYTCGIAFALEYTLDRAKKLVFHAYNEELDFSEPNLIWPTFLDDEPIVYMNPVGYSVRGGG